MRLVLDLKAIKAKLQPILEMLQAKLTAIVIVIIALLFGYMIWHIGMLANAEPTEDAVDEARLTISRPRIDKDAVAKIRELQSQNIDIQAIFPTDRNNPFQE